MSMIYLKKKKKEEEEEAEENVLNDILISLSI